MEPGDMLFYESARLVHGRPYSLAAESYCNVFAHYRAADRTYWPYTEAAIWEHEALLRGGDGEAYQHVIASGDGDGNPLANFALRPVVPHLPTVDSGDVREL
jgi:hypothetical protein